MRENLRVSAFFFRVLTHSTCDDIITTRGDQGWGGVLQVCCVLVGCIDWVC